MSGKKKKSKSSAGASLSDLLAEHTRTAEKEKLEIESLLHEKEEEERQKKLEEERRQKEILQKRLEEEKRRAEERFHKRQAGNEAASASGGEAAATIGDVPPPQASIRMPAPQKSHTVLAVFLTVIVMAGAAFGAWYLLFTDKSMHRAAMGHYADAVEAAAILRADALTSDFGDQTSSASMKATIEKLQVDVLGLKGEVKKVHKAEQDALAQVKERDEKIGGLEEKIKEIKAAKSGRKPHRGGSHGGGGVHFDPGAIHKLD